MTHGTDCPFVRESARSLLKRTLVFTLAVFALLEIWRPYYFLTDDNLSVGLPFLTEMGRHLKSGQSPFYSDYLFGGHYNLLRDVNYFSWHPLNFAVSLLADTPGRFAMLDVIALVHLVVTATGFALLAATVREDLGLAISDGRLLFLTLSFTFSTLILTTGASWVNFLANQSVLPWLVLGLWQVRFRRGLAVLVIASVHQALAGQSAATISNGLILTLFALILCDCRRSWRPMLMWIAANVITLVVILPLLWPALEGFSHSARGGGIGPLLMHRFNMPAGLAPFSFLFGNFVEMGAYFAHIPADSLAILYFPRLSTLMACAAAWCIFPLLLQRRRWTWLEGECAALIALLLLLVIRPFALTEIMSTLPILRSMRWPFREILQLLFFFHLLLVIRPWGGTPVMQNRIACLSFTFFALPLFFTAPLTLNPLARDRAALFSGQADHLWAGIKSHLRPGDFIATQIDTHLWYSVPVNPGYVLTATADYPAYFQVPCISGYSQTAPKDQLPIPAPPGYWFGAYDELQTKLLAKYPHVRVIKVTHIAPLQLTLSSPDPKGHPIDLTPYLNAR